MFLCFHISLVYEQANASPTDTRCYFQHSSICHVSTRTNQPGRLGHGQGHIPYHGGDCVCSFVVLFFVIILVSNLWVHSRWEEGMPAKEHVRRLLRRRKNTQSRVYTNSLEISWNLTVSWWPTDGRDINKKAKSCVNNPKEIMASWGACLLSLTLICNSTAVRG